MKKSTAFLMLLLGSWGMATAGEFRQGALVATWTDDTLTLGNGVFSHTLAASGDCLRTVSLRLTDGREAIRPPVARPRGRLAVACHEGQWSPVGEKALVAEVTCGARTYVFYVYPGVGGAIVSSAAQPLPDDTGTDAEPSKYRRMAQAGIRRRKALEGKFDALRFAADYVKVTTATLIDQTDVRNELLQTREWLMPSPELLATVACSSIDMRDPATGDGVVCLRFAPMPFSRPVHAEDAVIDASMNQVTLLENGYPLAILAYRGGEAGRLGALQAIQRAIRPYRPGRDGIFLSNTWGGGNRDSRINAEFLAKEIAAGAELGVDVIQIDDGWQRGRTANSSKQGREKGVWSGFWATDPNFWDPDLERFPGGLGPLVTEARAKGMRFGLWFGPDSSNEAVNWERDADKLLDYWRTFGIAYYKIDSLKLRSPTALARNRKFFDKMLAESGGEMVFDLDCTAEERPGYLGLPDIGPLFVENRYMMPSARRYRPHNTLRSLWSLAQVIDPMRLRMELLNPDAKREFCAGDPLGMDKWPKDALFAIAMTASPLGWMELSELTGETIATMKPLVARWKAERARYHGGLVMPVGAKPDGFSWTGFVSHAADGRGGYALLFREAASAERYELADATFAGMKAETIGGRGEARLEGERLVVRVPAKLDFIWVRFTPQ